MKIVVEPTGALGACALLESKLEAKGKRVGVVLSGLVERQGDRFNVSVKATRAVTGQIITTVSERTSSRDKVLAVTTSLAAKVRDVSADVQRGTGVFTMKLDWQSSEGAPRLVSITLRQGNRTTQLL